MYTRLMRVIRVNTCAEMEAVMYGAVLYIED